MGTPRAALAVLTLVLVGLLVLGPRPAPAGEGAEDALVTRLVPVGALTRGGSVYIAPTLTIVSPDMVSDAEHPLFGAEGEEPVLPLGSVDELALRVKLDVEPVAWQIVEGADVLAMGEHTLVVRAPPRVVEAVQRYLSGLERDLLATLSVDLCAVPLAGPGDLALLDPRAPPLSEEAAASFLARATDRVRLALQPGRTAVAWVGDQRSYLQDWDAEVAEKSAILDPIVGVLNTGFSVAVRALPGEQGQPVRLEVDADRVRADLGATGEAGGRPVQLPTTDAWAVRTEIVVEPLRWAALQLGLGGETPLLLLVRVMALPARGGEAHAASTYAPGPADAGPLVRRSFAIADLTSVRGDQVGPEMNLVPSNFTPPEPPELSEPAPAVAAEGLCDLLRVLVAPRSWNRDGAAIEAWNNRLFVTNTERLLDETARVLGDLRRDLLWTLVTDVVLLEGPAGLSLEPADGHLLGEEGLAALQGLRRERALVVKDAFSLTSVAGVQRAASSGTTRSYVQDYEVEVASEASIANPVIRTLHDGGSLTLAPSLTSGRDGAQVEIRYLRADALMPLGVAETPLGPVHVPALAVRQVKTSFHVPLGETALAGAWTSGDRASWLLVTPRLSAR